MFWSGILSISATASVELLFSFLLAVRGMEFSQCQLPCSRLITSGDQQSKCVRCVDLAHARDAIFGISNCKYCKNFTLKTVRAKLAFFDWESAVLPHCAAPEASSLCKATAWSSDAELEAMKSEQFSLSLSPSPGCYHGNSPVQFSRGCLAPSLEARWAVSFGLEDVLYTAASDSEDFRAASLDVLTPSGQEAWPSPAYTELVDVLACATEKLRLVWPDEPHEPHSSKRDKRFLSGSGSRPARRKLPFFPDLHQEISRSWKQPFSSCLTNAAAADFTNLVGSVEQGYGAVPAIKDTLAAHLSPTSAPSWKSRPLLASNSCRTTSALLGKSYMGAGQAVMAFHAMAILQTYQAEVLKEMDERDSVTPKAVKELRRATDLALMLLSIASPTSLDRDGLLKHICPSRRCSPPPTAPSSPLVTSREAQATFPLRRLLEVRDTSGFLPS